MTVAGSVALVRAFVIFPGQSVGVLLKEIVGQSAVLWSQFQLVLSRSLLPMRVGSSHCCHRLQPIPQPEVQISPPVEASAQHQVEQDKHAPEAERKEHDSCHNHLNF